MGYSDSAEIILRARDRLSDPDGVTFSASEMTRHLEAAVYEYSEYSPYMKTTTITTVAEQHLYDLPSDCLWLSRVWIDAADDDVADTIDNILLDMKDTLFQNEVHLWRAQLRERYATYGQPVAVLWNNQLYLYPETTQAGDTINVEYGSIHAKNSAGNYTTIQSNHIRYLEDMLVARCAEAMAMDYAKRFDYSDGQSRATYSHAAAELRRMASDLRARIVDNLSPVIGMVD